MYSQQVLGLIAACQWDTARFFIASGNVFDPFIYYSHLLPTLLSLAIGVFVFRHDRGLLGKTLLAITGLFSVWALLDLVLWATNRPEVTMFVWSVVNLIEPFIYASGVYFIYAFVTGRDLTFRQKLLIVLPLIPVILLAPTSLNVASFDLSNCNRDAIEGPLAYYNYVIEFLYVVWIAIAAGVVIKRDKALRSRVALAATGVMLFLLAFSWGNIVGTFTDDWQLPQWGLFGMPIFAAFLAYLVIRFRLLHVKIVSAQILVAASVIFVGSLFFAPTLGAAHVLLIPTLVILVVVGALLVHGVRREVTQREEIQALAKGQENLIHLLSHDVKGALTQVHGLVGGILEGDYGVVSDPLVQALQGLDTSTSHTIDMTTAVLKAGGAKTGRLTYEFKPFDLKQMVLEAIDSVMADAKMKKLKLQTDIPEGVEWTAIGDKAQILEHVLKNLLENAVIYTAVGDVTVTLAKTDKVYHLAVSDSGIGVTEADKARLFTEGGKGKDSTKINVHSTGYGLYLAKTVVEAHHGRIWAESRGMNQGSTFVVELPI